jgi:hypothetical protein
MATTTTPSGQEPPRSPPDAQAQTTPTSTAAACASLPSSLPIQTAHDAPESQTLG